MEQVADWVMSQRGAAGESGGDNATERQRRYWRAGIVESANQRTARFRAP